MPRASPARLRWGAALTIVLAVGATACGSPASSTPAPGAGSSAPSAVEAAGAYPVTIEHKYGSTEITAEPQRVVLVGLNEQDAMLALGEVPVATSNFLDAEGGIFPWAEAALGGAPRPVLLDQTDGIPFEEVAEQNPDLIVGLYAGLTPEQYATLSQIAPTVAQPGENFSISWQDTTLTLGKIFGKTTEAQKVIDDTEARFAQERAAHPEFAGKSAVTATFYEGYYVLRPVEQERDAQRWAVDHGAVVGLHLGDGGDPYVDELGDNAVWTSLPVVQQGRVKRMPDGIWMFGGPTSMDRYVDALVTTLGA